MTQERAKIIGRTNTYENFDSEFNEYEMKKSSNERKSKKSDDFFSSSKKSTVKSPNNSKTDLSKENKEILKNEFQEELTIELVETPTTMIFYNKSFFLQSEKEEELLEQEKRNKLYVDKSKETVNNDNYLPHSTQTYIFNKKNKFVQNEENDNNREIGVQVLGFKIKEVIEKKEKKEIDGILENMNSLVEEEMEKLNENPFTFLPSDINSIKFENLNRKKLKVKANAKYKGNNKKTGNKYQNNYTENTFLKSTQSLKKREKMNFSKKAEIESNENLTLNSSLKGGKVYFDQELNRFKESLQKDKKKLIMFDLEKKIYEKDNLKKSALLIEKMLNQFLLKKKYLMIRNYPEKKSTKTGNLLKNTFKKFKKEEKIKQEDQFLKKLLRIEFLDKPSLPINTIDQNPTNQNLFLSAHGNFTEESKKGLISLWTLKNPKHPEQSLETDSPVLTAKFSKNNPNLFACGFFNGHLSIYDTRQKLKKSVVSSKTLSDLQHLDSIWNLDWIPKGKRGSKSESIITISSDGKLFEWNLKKSLEVQELKIINRANNPQIKDNLSNNNINFRYSSGFHFDFHKTDPNIYYISTEEGLIHRCSKSYRERYLQTYYGHNGSVYKIKCNPFDSDILLSCSADWSVKIWNSKLEKSILSLKSLDLSDEIYDVAWNPFCSTSFASVCKDGRLEFWDIGRKNFDPVFEEKGNGISRNCVHFMNDCPVLMTGDMEGKIDVFRYFGYNESFVDEKKEVGRLHKTLNTKQFEKL